MLLAFCAFGLAGPPPLEPRLPGRKASLHQADVHIEQDAFIAMIFECDRYPADVTTMGVPAVETCRVLARPTPDSVVIYERSGSSLLFTSRQAVLWIRVVSRSAEQLRVEWDLVKQTATATGWDGAYAAALVPEAIRMPVSHGGWELDSAAHTAAYWLEVGLGGSVPDIFISEGALLGLTRALLARENTYSPHPEPAREP